MNTLLALAFVLAQAQDPAQWMDLAEWRFQPDPQDVGVGQKWYDPEYDDSDWATLQAGVRWEDQGYPDVDGYAWYRYTFTLPEAWRDKPIWFFANGINDSADLYFNGRLAARFGSAEVTVAQIAVWSLLPSVNAVGENVIALRIHDWGGSGGFWRLPVAITANPKDVPEATMVALHTGAGNDELKIEVDFRGLGSMNEAHTAKVAIERPRQSEECKVTAELDDAVGTIRIRMPDVQPGDDLRVHIQPVDAEKNIVANMTIVTTFEWPDPPGWPGADKDLKVLNTFVTDLYTGEAKEGTSTVAFRNPRQGWVFFAWQGDGNATGAVDGSELLWRENPDTGAKEAMRFLTEGNHEITVDGPRALLSIRTVPELAFCYYTTTPNITAYGPYDWAFMERHVLPHVNALVARSDIDAVEFQQWRDEGRRWIYNASLPGLSGPAPTADEVYDIWAANPGVTEPEYAGFIADEFLNNSTAHYAAWTEAVRRIHGLPAFDGKTFYAWCGDLHMHPPANDFVQALMGWGDLFVWERYQQEEPTAEAAERAFVREVTRPWLAWRNARPGMNEHMMMCLGYLSAPPESLNLNPQVDYHVFMDMQFHALATDPEFWNLYGVMEYAASYADEESLRWAHRLFRHYCIEGHTDRLTQDPYELTHIQNPDFTEDLSGWTVEAAEDGSIARGAMEGFSWLEGRYPRTAMGDTYGVFTRSAENPNRLEQTITGLDAGRLYSVKMISADIAALDQAQELGLFLTVDRAEVLPEHGFQTVFRSNYAHELPPYNAQNPAHFNLHRLVFRATTPTAELTIGDWRDGRPAGPVGQRIAFNFVETQPFRWP